MRHNLLAKWASAVLAANCAISVSNADTNAIETHNIRKTSDGIYIVGQNDPYFVFNLRGDSNTTLTTLQFDIAIDTDSTDLSNVPMELFFHYESQRFSPLYRIVFSVPASQSNIALQLPANTNIKPGDKLRLDINNCARCKFSMLNAPKLVGDSEHKLSSARLIQAQRVYNGASQVSKSGNALDTKNWQLHDLKQRDGKLQPTGNDPYLVSGLIDIDTSQLGGIYFQLEVSQTTATDYQVFYATERHEFIESASAVMRVTPQPGGYSEFVLPLDFLSNESPVAQLLRKLRLDIVTDDQQNNWAIKQVTLLHKDQINKFQSLVPARLTQSKQQRATGLGLAAKIVKNILSDLGFALSYLLLLTLTSVFLWRAYKR